MKIERTISIYEKKGDRWISELRITTRDFRILKRIIPAQKKDPKYYNSYKLDDQASTIAFSLYPSLMEYPLSKYEWFMQCWQAESKASGIR